MSKISEAIQRVIDNEKVSDVVDDLLEMGTPDGGFGPAGLPMGVAYPQELSAQYMMGTRDPGAPMDQAGNYMAPNVIPPAQF